MSKSTASKSSPRPSATTPASELPRRPLTADDNLYLIDGSAYIFRAFFAMFKASQARGRSFTRSDGTPTGAVMTFSNMLWKMVREGVEGGPPTRIGVIFDHSADTFRNELYPEYKANRDSPPDELIPQFPLIREAVRGFGLNPIEQIGFEADDLIATYARLAGEIGATVTIISGDKDLMQLVGSGVSMYDPMPGREKVVGVTEVHDKFGVAPNKVIDVQALAGDSTDNVPGVPGIGVKTAAQLIGEYGDLETLLANAESIKQKKRRENLIEFAELARISRQLVELKNDVDLDVPLDAVDLPEIDAERLVSFCKAMEFRTFTERVAKTYELDIDAIAADPALASEKGSSGGGSTSHNVVDDSGEGSADGASSQADRADGSAGWAYTPTAAVAILQKAALSPEINTDSYVAVTKLEDLQTWVDEAIALGRVAFDCETDSLDAMRANLVGVSLATAPGRACYVPLAHGKAPDGGLDLDGGATPEQIPMRAALDLLRTLLEHPGVLKIGQNIKYDLQVMRRHGVNITPLDDTLLLSFALDAGRAEHGMDALAMKWLEHKCIAYKEVAGTGKSQVTFDQVAVEKALPYAAEDADVTLRLWMMLKPRLAAERMTTVYETLERPLVPILADMERAGVSVDRGILARLSSSFAQSLARLESEIHETAGKPFNVGSPKQLGEILFDEWGLPGGKKTKTGAWQTGAGVLEDLVANDEVGDTPRQLVATILEWRQLSKLKSTYTDALQGFINPETTRVHTTFALASAGTGRLSSSEPNVQNIPVRTKEGREIRTAFVAGEGMKLISADYSQIELRVLAHIADIPALKAAFADGLDIHAMTASEMFDVPLDEMTPEVRRRAKAINFGIIYGISAFGLAAQLQIPRGEAKAYIDRYFERFPGIRTYMKDTVVTAKRQGYVETIFGRRIHYPDIQSSNPARRGFFERAAINAPIQGSAADVIRRAMVRMPDAMANAKLTGTMLLQVHDELVFEVPEAEVEATIQVARAVMEGSHEPVVTLSVPLKVDAGIGDNWDAAH